MLTNRSCAFVTDGIDMVVSDEFYPWRFGQPKAHNTLKEQCADLTRARLLAPDDPAIKKTQKVCKNRDFECVWEAYKPRVGGRP